MKKLMDDIFGKPNQALIDLAPQILDELILFVDIADTGIDEKSPELVLVIDYARDLIKRAKGEQ